MKTLLPGFLVLLASSQLAYGADNLMADFSASSSTTPLNWNAIGPGNQFTSLVQTDGTPTTTFLNISGSTGRIQRQISPPGVPTFFEPLGQMSDFAIGNTAIRATIGGLLPGESYTVWVFGLYDGSRPNTTSQRIDLIGASTISYTMPIGSNIGRLWVNDRLGTPDLVMESVGIQVISDSRGTIDVLASNNNPTGGEVALAGLALRGPFQVIPEPSVVSLLILGSGIVVVGWRKRLGRKP